MRAHLVQLNIAWQDKPSNFSRVAELLAHAEVQPGDFVLLPEMFDTGFSFTISTTADDKDETLNFVRSLAEQYSITVQAGRTARAVDSNAEDQSDPLRGRNEAPIVSPAGVIATYTKIHPFSHGLPGNREVDTFDSGDEVVIYPWDAAYGKHAKHAEHGEHGEHTDGASLLVCPAICYDLRFAELFRRGLDMGAQMFALGANWPVARQSHWRALLIARAIENQAFMLGVNRVGTDPSLTYVGGSIAIGPKGDILGELSDEEAVLSVEIDPSDVTRWRAKFHAWEDRRLGLEPRVTIE